ncbi:MAG: pyridoxal phosphate-dependent aminotransferase [candidate division Zixibacteria bacterium]|nr:pyridoxal phosphate-dependent aminotransferase [candidate division Zixibacteria bacterium]NIR67917.1 pyridoxal phosphate-dependent aminotransferase [candidate division Zixibacteria bacterium]NIS16280.1 pyridoxal phosphate-dependent aminotransferase [candidate division Zixibacteria bacterium]NIS49134.1 pyridoxal phosphate-dependent aminotransferase [candidate division Zixibacteria bacterium]NIT53642.1 pyridoxal phosphate-dependent aminotransferase [candidate division Zixibacteria bacterium]
MPAISDRGNIMPESPIRKLVPFAEAAKKRGRTVYHLNIGQPDIPSPEDALAYVRSNNLTFIEYSHSAGNESYRRKLAEYYKKYDIDVDYTDMIITTGGSEAIIFAFMSCMNPGEEVIISEPFYTNYNGFAIEAGVKIRPVTARIEDKFALPPVSEFEKLINEKTRAILINNPNNPTGYLYRREELEAIKDLVKKHDLYLLADEVYKEFCYDGREYVSVMHLKGIEDRTVLMDSVSKRYSMCGVRIGSLISRNKDIISTALKFAQARLSPPSYGQIAGEAAVATPDSYFEQVRSEYVKRRDIVVESLNKIEGVFCPKPSGAFYCAVRLPIDDDNRFCQWLLEDFEYENQTVMLAPLSGFYSTPGLGKNEIRIGYVLKVDSLKKAMKCIEEALKVYPGRIK